MIKSKNLFQFSISIFLSQLNIVHKDVNNLIQWNNFIGIYKIEENQFIILIKVSQMLNSHKKEKEKKLLLFFKLQIIELEQILLDIEDTHTLFKKMENGIGSL